MGEETERAADAVIRGAGLKVTASRAAVLDALSTRPHARADELFDAVHAAVPATSLQSVYNALGDFVDAGIVRRIEPAGHPGLFELRVGDNHHHAVCTRCGRVDDVECVVGAAPCLHVPEGSGYDIRSAEVTFWGVCPACRAEAAGSDPTDSHQKSRGTE